MHCEHNKWGLLTISLILLPQIINETIDDQMWNICNSVKTSLQANPFPVTFNFVQWKNAWVGLDQ